VPNSRADVWNKKTILTVNEPIQVPGQVLQPGKYVMKLMDSPSNRHIVQVFNEDESKLLTTVLALPNYRLQPTGETRFTFWETVSGEPKPLRSWFYPGDNFGQEFVYPKDRAVQIAQYTKETVPMTTTTTESDLSSARIAAVTPQGVEGELDKQTYTKPEPTVAQEQAPATPAAPPAETQIAQATPQPAPAAAPEADRQQELPATGSPVPMIALAGALSLMAGAGLRMIRR
jgi:LPXTG-motif cell wall-anchored protein